MAEYPLHLARQRTLADGRVVLIRPIRAEDEPLIFLPFFSTREKGMGLGLPMAERIVREHHGTSLMPGLAAHLFPAQLLSSAVGAGVLVARLGAFAGPPVGAATIAAESQPAWASPTTAPQARSQTRTRSRTAPG